MGIDLVARLAAKAAGSPEVLDDEVLALHVAEVAQTLLEFTDSSIGSRRGAAVTEPTDPVHFRRGLRSLDDGRAKKAQDDSSGAYKETSPASYSLHRCRNPSRGRGQLMIP